LPHSRPENKLRTLLQPAKSFASPLIPFIKISYLQNLRITIISTFSFFW
jgi:hypothetical protein